MAFAQTGSIKGKVLDETNAPLPGAAVSVDGTTTGATTDANGNFIIAGLKTGNVTVTAKFLGYLALKKTVTVATGTVEVNFNLKPDNQNLNEVVVVGYGTQKKKDLTGSVTTISSKDFNQGPVTTPEQLITGKVSGVQITSNSGQPGSGSTIRIRGGASLNASNDPLIVVDGIPLSNSGISGVSNPLSLINPNDIESYNILKDASATAIYGSRASNGVIIITTKKGKGDSKLSINFDSKTALSKVTKEVSVLSADQFRAAVKAQNPGQANLLGTANTDWQSLIYRPAYTYDNNLSISGGVKGLPYRLSIGYLDQDGIVKTDNLKRTTATFNVSHDFLHNSLKVDLTLKGSFTKSNFAAGAIGSAISFDPTQPVYSNDKTKYGGYFEWLDSSGNPNTLAPRNPVGLLNEQSAVGKASRGIGTLNVNYVFPFLKELQFNATVGGDLADGHGDTFIPATAASNFLQGGSYSAYNSEIYTYNTDYYLKYTKDLKDINSHVELQGGYSYQYFNTYYKTFQGYKADKKTPVGTPATPSFGQYYIESPFARLNYSFNDRYLLTATIRDDRSSRFSDLHRNGYFPSVAFAWRAKEESFLKNVDFLSDLKLRASYGITGQQDIGSYFPYLAVYEPSNSAAQYQFGNTFYNTLRSDAYNADLKWESTATTNLGLDFGFLNGKINGTIDVYNKKTKDLLIYTPIPAGTNLSNYINANIGNLTTRGIDFNINYVAITTKDINWTLGYNISLNQRKITNISLTGDPNQTIAVTGIPGGVGNTIGLYKAGQNPGAFYVYQQVYDQNGLPLEGVYVDRNKNGSTLDDKYLYKQSDPKVFMGFNSNFSYKQWNLGFSARANLGNYLYNAQSAANGAYAGIKFSGYLGNLPSSVLQTQFQQYQLYSDYYVENASFVRMDYATLGYTFPIIGGHNLRASFNVNNVFVITKYKGLDPEINGGVDNNFYPRPRVYTLGLNLSL